MISIIGAEWEEIVFGDAYTTLPDSWKNPTVSLRIIPTAALEYVL